MLFYNENDEICLKSKDDNCTIIRELDYFELDGEWYRYSNNYFYEALEYDGDLDTYWDRRIHVRHMDIVEIEEAFSPPSYKSNLDCAFKYEENLCEDAYYLMYTIARKIENSYLKGNEYTSAKVEKMEFENLGEEGVREVLNLLHDDFTYDLEITENPSEYGERANIFITWSEYEN